MRREGFLRGVFEIAIQRLPIGGPLTPNQPVSTRPIFRIRGWHVRRFVERRAEEALLSPPPQGVARTQDPERTQNPWKFAGFCVSDERHPPRRCLTFTYLKYAIVCISLANVFLLQSTRLGDNLRVFEVRES